MFRKRNRLSCDTAIAFAIATALFTHTPASAATQFDFDAARAGVTSLRLGDTLRDPHALIEASRRPSIDHLFDFLQYTSTEVLGPRIAQLHQKIIRLAPDNRETTAREAQAVFEQYGKSAPATIGEAFRFGTIFPQVAGNAEGTRDPARAKNLLDTLASLNALDESSRSIRDLRVTIANIYSDDWRRQATLSNILGSLVAVGGIAVPATVRPEPIAAFLAVGPISSLAKPALQPYIELVQNDGSVMLLQASTDGGFAAPGGRVRCEKSAAPAAAPYAALLLLPDGAAFPTPAAVARTARDYAAACSDIEKQRAIYTHGIRNEREATRDIIRAASRDDLARVDRFLDFFKIESR